MQPKPKSRIPCPSLCSEVAVSSSSAYMLPQPHADHGLIETNCLSAIALATNMWRSGSPMARTRLPVHPKRPANLNDRRRAIVTCNRLHYSGELNHSEAMMAHSAHNRRIPDHIEKPTIRAS
jgi:hypothetical protein